MLFKNIFGKNARMEKPVGPKDDWTVTSPAIGAVIPLASVNDKAFAEGMMGPGIAIAPTSGKIVSPVDGVVDTLAETLHAVGLHSDSGLDVLIHVGLDTVKLNGKYFSAKVAEGQRVKRGDSLIEFDAASIESAGYEITTPMTIVNADEFAKVTVADETSAGEGTALIWVTPQERGKST